jgi:hypothetical protein
VHGKFYFKRKKIMTKKKSLLNWEERRNEERKKYLKITAGKFNIEKINDERGVCFNCNKSAKLTYLACSICNKFSIRNVFQFIINCTYLKNKKIPMSVT